MTGTRPRPGPDLPVVAGSAELLGYGRVSWDQLIRLLGGAQAAWADYDGFHIGPPPAGPPPYSHLWAWTDEWLARARIDGDTAIVGVLAIAGKPQDGPTAKPPETVHFQVVRATTWMQNEKRVGELTADLADRRMDVYLIPGEHPITFVASAATGS
jgi:hypothetical protein